LITTLKDFILKLEKLKDISHAFEVFEFDTSEEVRDLIYSMSPQDEPEPFRYAMRLMGYVTF
jgi:hypothetical protein